MKCSNCGKDLNEKSAFCTNCGTKVGETRNSSNGSSSGWGVLGFFFPVIGLVLYLVWKESKPSASKASGIGALISFILNIVIYIIYLVIAIVMFS